MLRAIFYFYIIFDDTIIDQTYQTLADLIFPRIINGK